MLFVKIAACMCNAIIILVSVTRQSLRKTTTTLVVDAKRIVLESHIIWRFSEQMIASELLRNWSF